MMKRLILTILLAAGAMVLGAQHVPGDGAPYISPAFEIQGHTRFFLDLGDVDLMSEILVRYDGDQLAYDADAVELYGGFGVGGYYRLHRNLKLGAFYRLQIGARHDEDWIAGTPWVWRDTSDRIEHVGMIDVSPRFLLDFLPGENWVLGAKVRYELTTYQESGRQTLHTLLIRPGLTYFVMQERDPVLNLSLHYGTYWSLGFGESPWYRHGPYASVLYHVTPGLKFDLNLGRQFVYWTESSEFDAAWPNNRYAEPLYKPWTIDLGVIVSLDQ